MSEQIISDTDIRDFTSAIKREIDEAFEFALASPFPEPEQLSSHLFSATHAHES